MPSKNASSFNATIELIGINPFVFVPEKILDSLFKTAGREKGPIPICGTINGKTYRQTLVKYRNEWRLYINTSMLSNSPRRIGEKIAISIAFDHESREIAMPEAFTKALKKNKAAALAFEKLTPSRQKEIVRYLANLKTTESQERNILKALGFLTGGERFAGRTLNSGTKQPK